MIELLNQFVLSFIAFDRLLMLFLGGLIGIDMVLKLTFAIANPRESFDMTQEGAKLFGKQQIMHQAFIKFPTPRRSWDISTQLPRRCSNLAFAQNYLIIIKLIIEYESQPLKVALPIHLKVVVSSIVYTVYRLCFSLLMKKNFENRDFAKNKNPHTTNIFRDYYLIVHS